MRNLYQVIESILDNDDKIKNDAVVNSILIKIKGVLISLFGEEYKTHKLDNLKFGPKKGTDIIFSNHNVKYKSFDETIQSLKKGLHNIKGIELNWKTKNINELFRNFQPTSKLSVVEWKIFYDNKVILEFIMRDGFVNYNVPIAGLSYDFVFTDDCQKFIDLFK